MAKKVTDLLAQRAVATFAIASADLQHHHHKHGHIEQEHQAEVANAGGVEDDRTLDPAAEEKYILTNILVSLLTL